MSEKKFIDGLIVKAPRDGAPEYLICKLSIKREELIAWLQQQNGDWINADVKVSQGGKFYAQVDDWKPDNQRGGGHGGRRGGQEQRRPRQQTYEEVRDQRLGDLQRSTPMDDFADDDLNFMRWGVR